MRLIEPPRLRGRYRRVMRFFFGAVVGLLWWELLLRRVGLGAIARRTAPWRYRRIAHRFRRLAGQLGGVWIKVGQFLSARVDILPYEVTGELEGLQDEVAPEAFSAMRATIEAEFDRPLDQVFPEIERRADLDALFEEFSRTLWAELDYLAEAQNAERFRGMFAGDPRVRIPAVHHELSTRRVLTLEDVYQIKITDYAAIQRAGIDRRQVADRLFQTYLRQIFEEGFFHAHPHPGNLFTGLQPYAERLLLEEGGSEVLDWLIEQLKRLAAMPARVEAVLGRIERGDLSVRAEAGPELSAQLGGLTRAINRLTAAVVLLGLIGAGTVLWLQAKPIPAALILPRRS